MTMIDRFLLADHGSPRRLANAITDQLPPKTIPVPIHEIAKDLDIVDIRYFETDGFEGGLVAFEDKSEGTILVNGNSSEKRQRFTIGHELGHFLIPTHTGKRGEFLCTKEDLRANRSSDITKRKEIEANQFSVELLMPEKYFRKDIRVFGEPDISNILTIAQKFNMSIESTARRYVELSDYHCAIVFSRQGRVRYHIKSESFPWLEPGKDCPIPTGSLSAVSSRSVGDTSQWEEVNSDIWISDDSKRYPEKVLEQTLLQQNDYRISLLFFEEIELDEDEEEEEWPEPTFSK
jgi:Zn-dependent peptidase ImmA (M78 family)